ncbi:MAG: SDR family oxidoreductase [Nakamurella sp.]
MTTSRVCLVTGASRGIGRAVVADLIASGHRVVAVARQPDALAELVDSVGADAADRIVTVAADVTDAAAIERCFQAAESAWGSVEVLVAAAGAGEAAPLAETSDELWDRMLDLNLTAPFRCLRRAIPAMTAARWGRVVMIGSVVSKRGEPMISAYTASKHGLLGLARAAAAELASTGITVNTVCPGYVDTPMTQRTVIGISERSGRSLAEARQVLERRQPIGRLIDPTEVAAAVRFCIDNGAVTGQGLNIDGGAVQS